jgi:predicted PurR-regulated permease PerM
MIEIRSLTESWRVLALLVLVGLVVYLLRFVLLPFTFAAALAYVAHPVQIWLQKKLRLHRVVAVVLTFCLVVCGILGISYWILSTVAQDFVGLVTRIPDILHRLIRESFGERIYLFGTETTADALTNRILTSLAQSLGTSQELLDVGTGAAEFVAGFFLTLVLLFYFLLSGPKLARGALWLAPPPDRAVLEMMGRQINPVLGRYIRGVFIVVAITTLISWIGIGVVLRLPHASILAVATGLLEMVPVLGPVSSVALVGVVAIEEGTVATVVGVAIFFIALRLAIDQLIGPLILGRSVMLHPTVIIFSFLAGAVLFGALGLLLAIPVASGIKIVLADLYGEPLDGTVVPKT